MTPLDFDTHPASRSLVILDQLGLTPEECDSLRRQGFVAAERRGPACVVFKLRFRMRGRQVVRYLGTDPEWADTVRRALSAWQSPQHAQRLLRRTERDSRRLLRSVKPRLIQAVEAAGLKFHGRQIRRPRQSMALPRSSSTIPTSRRRSPAQRQD